MGHRSIIERLRLWLAEKCFLLAGWLDESYDVRLDNAPPRHSSRKSHPESHEPPAPAAEKGTPP